MATRVAGTLTAAAPAESETATQQPSPTESVRPLGTESPGQSPTPTATAPNAGISLNCDETYQRVRLIDRGSEGRTLIVDEWTGSTWDTRWRYDGGDPNIRQLTDRAGAYSLGGCRQLLVVPLLYTGSGAVIELHVFEWTDEGAVEVHSDNGTHGDWQIVANQLRFERSLYLYDEPNCCPCNREVTEHEWNGSAFIEVETEIRPTYTGTPPPICQP